MHSLIDKILLIAGILFLLLFSISFIYSLIEFQKKKKKFREELEEIRTDADNIRIKFQRSNSYDELYSLWQDELRIGERLENLEHRIKTELY